VMQVPRLIWPPTDATPAEAAAARGPRALPHDFLREASARLGIMSLVAAGLWIVGTILGRLAMRSMQGDAVGLGPTMGDAIAAVSVLASLLLFAAIPARIVPLASLCTPPIPTRAPVTLFRQSRF